MVGCWTRKRLLVLFALLEASALLFATVILIRAQPRPGSLHAEEAVVVPSSLPSTMMNVHDPVTAAAAAPDFREPNDTLLVESSSSSSSSFDVQRLVELVSPRAFPRWNNLTVPLPCPEAEGDWTSFRAQRSKTRTGFLFVKVPKTGSSTGASVNLRIASRIYHKMFASASSGGDASSTLVDNINGSSNNASVPAESKRLNRRQIQRRRRQQQQLVGQRRRNHRLEQQQQQVTVPPLCKNRVQHANTHSLGYDQRHKSRSVLWTVVRDPTDRAVSEFFHFHVSRRGRNGTDDAAFRDYVRGRRTRFRNFQVAYLALRKVPVPVPVPAARDRNGTSIDASDDGIPPVAHRSTTSPVSQPADVSVDTIRSILRDYDFVGVSERMDESLVALQLLLGLEASDILHMRYGCARRGLPRGASMFVSLLVASSSS
jgi:Sulfotransferase family